MSNFKLQLVRKFLAYFTLRFPRNKSRLGKFRRPSPWHYDRFSVPDVQPGRKMDPVTIHSTLSKKGRYGVARIVTFADYPVI